MPTRREMLKLGLGASASLLAGACAPRLVRPPSCLGPPAGSPLAIDAHCHIFNGTDLQVAGFIDRIKLRAGEASPFASIGRWVQDYAWSNAPTAARELEWLQSSRGAKTLAPTFVRDDYASALGSVVKDMGKDSDQVFDEFLRWLATKHADDARVFAHALADRRPADEPALLQMYSADEVFDLFGSQAPGATLIEREFAVGPYSILAFLKTFFRYRTENVWTMQQIYGCDSSPSVALLCPAMVDYDLWIGDIHHHAGATPSSIESQLRLMRELAHATEGRVHGFAPFNPLRAACDPSYMELSKRAVKEFGCIGFKLYPPMGFRAIDNPPQPVAGTSRSCPVDERLVPGHELDAKLHELYAFCAKEGVPIMAHSAHSNGPSDDAESGASPVHWGELVRRHPEYFHGPGNFLRISLGHMGGDTGKIEPQPDWREETLGLIRQYPGIIYADLSYHEHMLGNAEARKRLARQLAFLASDPQAAQSVMYGSDWSMLALQSHANRYLSSFYRFMHDDVGLHDEARLQQLLAGNARRFFALEPGQAGHARLQGFHAADKRRPIPFLQLETP